MNCQFCGQRAVIQTFEVSDLHRQGDERREQHHVHCEHCGRYRVTGTVKDGYDQISETACQLIVDEMRRFRREPLITSSFIDSIEERINE